MTMIKTFELDYRSIASGTHNNEKELRPQLAADGSVRRASFSNTWRDGYVPEKGMAYFATPYTLNTKYVVGAKNAVNIGCLVELPSGKIVHLDLSVDQIEHAGNRR